MGLDQLDQNIILAIFYAWNNVIGIIIFTILFLKSNRNKQTSHQYFSLMILCMIVYFLGDILWKIANVNLLPFSDILIKLGKIIYYSAGDIMSFFWLMYVCILIDFKPLTGNKKNFLLFPLTAAIVANIVFCSNMDSSNMDSYRVFISCWLILPPAVSIIISIVIVINKIKNINDKALKNSYFRLIIWPLVVLASAILQIIFEALPIFCSGIILVILLTYIYNQDSFIFTDPLTEINNRNMINRYLNHIKNYSDTYYLLMIDINNFKSINDTYGHIEGDKALKHMANILKKVAGDNNYFLARYGGDEFIIIAKSEDEEKIQEFINRIHQEFNYSKDDLGFSYSTSIGYTKMDKELSIERNIANADKYLYKKKRQFHRNDSRKA